MSEKPKVPGPGKVARTYFDAVAARDVDAMAACWARRRDRPPRSAQPRPAACPTRCAPSSARPSPPCPTCASRCSTWSRHATRPPCAGARPAPSAAGRSRASSRPASRIELEGIDLLTVEDGKIQRNDAYYDSAQFARADRPAAARGQRRWSERMAERVQRSHAPDASALFKPSLQPDRRRRVAGAGRLPAEDDERLPDRGRGPGDRLRRRHQGDDERHRLLRRRPGRHQAGRARPRAPRPPRRRTAVSAPRSTAIPTRSRRRRATAASTTSTSRSSTGTHAPVMPRLTRLWDGGPVQVEGTVSEGDDIAGFQVVAFPGHAPGMIGLWRESRPAGARERHALHAQPADRDQGRSARAASRVQPRHRAGDRQPPQAGGDGAGHGLARARRTRSRATCAAQLERAADAG